MLYDVCDRIKRLREQKSMTQAELAKRLGITRASVNGWEMGLSVPSTQRLVELADIFDVSIDFLLGRKNSSSVSVTGLTDQDIEIVLALISHFRDKNQITKT